MSFKVSSNRRPCDGLEVHTVLSTKSTETAVGHELDITKTNLRFFLEMSPIPYFLTK